VKSFCDTNVLIYAAIEPGCDRLYSEDLQHGRRFGDCAVVNPFRNGGF
jgi:predicted nucleic acid-binding protein